MSKLIKSFLYIGGCVVIFFLILRAFDVPLPSNSANAFEWEKTVKIYLVDSKKAERGSCEADMAVERVVLNAETLGPGAIDALIKGPTLTDLEQGFYSSINRETLLQKFEIRDKVAYADFDFHLNDGVAGSCNVLAIRSQIEKTLENLPDIDSVVISVNGKTDGILEP